MPRGAIASCAGTEAQRHLGGALNASVFGVGEVLAHRETAATAVRTKHALFVAIAGAVGWLKSPVRCGGPAERIRRRGRARARVVACDAREQQRDDRQRTHRGDASTDVTAAAFSRIEVCVGPSAATKATRARPRRATSGSRQAHHTSNRAAHIRNHRVASDHR